jgi:hypothetical protein
MTTENFEYTCETCGRSTVSSEINLETCPIPLRWTSDMVVDENTPRCGGPLWGPTVDLDDIQTNGMLLTQIAREADGPVWELLEYAAQICIQDVEGHIVRRWSPEAISLSRQITQTVWKNLK